MTVTETLQQTKLTFAAYQTALGEVVSAGEAIVNAKRTNEFLKTSSLGKAELAFPNLREHALATNYGKEVRLKQKALGLLSQWQRRLEKLSEHMLSVVDPERTLRMSIYNLALEHVNALLDDIEAKRSLLEVLSKGTLQGDAEAAALWALTHKDENLEGAAALEEAITALQLR